MTHLAYPVIVFLQLACLIVSTIQLTPIKPSTTTTTITNNQVIQEVPVKRTSVQETFCNSDKVFDATLFDHSIWNHVENKTVRNDGTMVTETYHFSFCQLLGWHNSSSIPSECNDYHVCHVIDNHTHPVISGYKELDLMETDHKGLVILVVKGDRNDTGCPDLIKPTVTIDFPCDRKRGLGHPTKIVSSPCSAHFSWPTIAACTPRTPNILSKCYTYDSNGEIRDLSPLIAEDGYEVLSPPEVNSTKVIKNYFINICSEVGTSCKNGRSKSEGTAACSVTPRDFTRPAVDHLGYIRKSTLLYDEVQDEVILTYQEPTSTGEKYECTHQTHIRFRCPKKSSDVNIYGLESRKPFLISSGECETVIEWETDHACPVHKLKGNMSTCIIEDDEGFRIDLSPLQKMEKIVVKNISLPNAGNITFDATLAICGSFQSAGISCPDNRWKGNAACINDSNGSTFLIGSKMLTTNAELAFNDGSITLVYNTQKPADGLCKDANPVTTVNFVCDTNAVDPNVTFVSMTPTCEFIFKVETKHACHPEHLQVPSCSLEYNGTQFDLSPLRKKTHEFLWTASVNPYKSVSYTISKDERLMLNVCGAIPKAHKNNNTCADLPSNAAACLYNGKFKTSRNIGQFTNPLTYDPDTQTIVLSYETTSVKEKKTLSMISFKCAPGHTDSSPALVSRTANSSVEVFNFEWKTSVACPLKTSVGSDCIVRDETLGYTYDLNPLRTDHPVIVEWGKYKFYVSACGPLHYNPCKDKDESAAICQQDIKNNDTYVSGQGNGDLMFYDGVLKLTYTNGSKYRNPEQTPRSAEIIFVCDEEDKDVDRDITKPRLDIVSETNRTYYFRWFTKHACPDFENIVPCLWTNGTHSIDLSPLSLEDHNHFQVLNNKRDTGGSHHKYFANVCRPLNPTRGMQSCRKGSAMCWQQVGAQGEPQNVTSLGIPTAPPNFYDGENFSLIYNNGDSCINSEKKNKTWSSQITFVCDSSDGPDGEFHLTESGDCFKKFEWRTSLVCDLLPEAPKPTKTPPKYIPDSESASSGDSKDSSKPGTAGVIIITVIAFLAILFAIFILVNREVRLRSLFWGDNSGTSRSMCYSQLTTNDFNTSADQVAFISGHSSLSPYNTTTTSMYGPSLYKNSSYSNTPAQKKNQRSNGSNDGVPFPMYDDDDIDLLT